MSRLAVVVVLFGMLAIFPSASAARAAVPIDASATAAAPAAALDNPVTVENRNPGTYSWLHGPLNADDTNGQIKGYWSAVSAKPGDTINLMVSVNPVQTWSMDIFRMGWYGGTGARLRTHVGPVDGTTQAPCVPNPDTGLIACGWTPSYSLTIPSDWTSGVYLGLMTNAAGYQNHVIFVVRDDRPAAFLYMQNIATDQAYNNYPNDGVNGKSLYPFNSYGANTIGGDRRAVKVSFDRPYADYGFMQIDQLEFIRWIESQGYDVTYSTSLDTHTNGSRLLQHKALLDVGHDEYWSLEMRNAVEAARDGGVNVAFFAADNASWQVRFEPAADGTPNRVMVCYRTGTLDPVIGPTTTVHWHDFPASRPEQPMIGIASDSMLTAGVLPKDYVVKNSAHWIYGGTGFNDGDIVTGILGYEMDAFDPRWPATNTTTFTLLGDSPYVDYAGASRRSNSSLYQAPSGALVFASGTISWSWGLDGFWHQRQDPRIQRTTANLLNAFLNGAPVDHLALTGPATAVAGQPITLTVAAADPNGRTVAEARGSVHFSSTDASTSAFASGDATLTNGAATFIATLATAGTQTITVTDTARSLTATLAVNVTAAPASQLALATTATPVAGQSFSFSVTARDQYGNTDPTYTGRIHFTATDAAQGVVLPADATLTAGSGTFQSTLIRAGAQTITATDIGQPALTGALPVTVRAANATRLAIASANTTPTAGTSFSLTVTALDQFGNTDTAYGGRVHFTSTDTSAGVTLPADSTLASGVGTFSATLTRAGAQTLTGRDTSISTITGSVGVTVVPAAAAVLTIAAPESVLPGASFNFTVTLTDQYANVATGYRGRLHFTTSDPLPTATVPGDYTFTAADAGTRQFSARLTTPPSQTITARDTVNPALTQTKRISVLGLF